MSVVSLMVWAFVVLASSVSTASPAPATAGGRATCLQTQLPTLARAVLSDGTVARITPGALHIGDRSITRCDGLPGAHPLALVATDSGFVVGFRDAGAQRFDGEHFAPIEGLPKSPVRALAFGDGQLWIGTASEGLWEGESGGAATRHTHRILGKRGITALAYRSGALHIGSDPTGHWKLKGERVVKLSKRPVGCFGSSPGLSVRSPGSDCGLSGQGPLHVTALATHRGQMMVATFDQGLHLLRGNTFKPIDGSPRFLNALLSVDDDLFLGTAQGLFRMRKGEITRVPLGLPSEHINALARGSDGTLWIATSRGVASLEAGRVRLLGVAQGLPSRIAYALAVTDDGALWVGTAAGAVRLAHDDMTLYTQAGGALPHDWVTALRADGNHVYAGTYDAGVARLEASGKASPLEGLEHTWVNPAGVTAIDGMLAVATLGDGLWFHDGDSAVRGPRLPSNDVTAILRFGDTLWVGTRAGLATLQMP